MGFVYSLKSEIIVSKVTPLSSLSQTYLIDSAIVAATTAIGKQTFWDDPTALN